MNISFRIDAIPIAQPRAKATAFNGKARMYEAKKSHPIHDFKASVRMTATQHYKGAPLDEPLGINIVFVMPRPSNMNWKSKPTPRVPYCCKGRNDWDNLGKGLADALTGIIWADDGLIAKASVEKWIASGDEPPHVEVSIWTL